MTETQIVADLDQSNDPDSDADYNQNKSVVRKSKPKTITIEVPTDIVKQTSITSARLGVSARAQTMLLANVITCAGGNLDEIVLSKTSANRYRKEMVSKAALSIRDEISFLLAKIGRKFVLHFDRKLIQDITGSSRSVKERLAVLISSPEMETEQVLGVPALESGSGESIMAGIMEVGYSV